MRTLPGNYPLRRQRVFRKAISLATALFLALGITALNGCGGGTTTPTGVTITGPSNATIDPGNSANFSATVTGGPLNAGVTWTLTGCTVTNCGTLTNSTTTGVTYTAPTTVPAAFTVTLTAAAFSDASVTATSTLSVPVNPAITTPVGALPSATYAGAYTTTLAATGGITPYTWSISQGALPTGLSLSSSTGAISGSSTGAGTASFTVTITDSGNPALTASSAFTITTGYPGLSITTPSLPNGAAGTAYSAALAATGGSGTGYTYAVTAGTGLSAVGLTLSSNGVISGTPTTGEAAGSVTITVTDSAGNKASATFSLTVAYPTLTITSLNLSSGVAGNLYSSTLTATGGNGTPYTWSVTSGASSLSAIGLSVSSTGLVTGTTPTAGTATFTVKVTDTAGDSATASLTVTITPSLTITTATLPPGTEGTAYNTTLAATGGTNTGYTWSVVSGTALSAEGLTLSPAGVISGIPTKGETSVPVTIEVTDSANDTATATLTLTVTAVAFQGQVLSGTTPVTDATIQLYAAGSTGNMSAATPMLTQSVITDGLGMFQLTGEYTCGQSSTGQTIPATAQLYLVATGGSNNPALTMVTAIGPCTNLTSTSFNTLNEITTAAAAWALAPFASSTTTIGATATNTLGLTNAFLDAALLANPATGSAATLPANLTIENAKLSALADALNTCTTGTGTGCASLFAAATPPSGSAPTDTFTAALNITHNPGQNVAAVFNTLAGTPPFPTTLTAAPNDWTMSLTVTGGGLYIPTALGIDTLNNIWVADETGPLSAFSAQGTPLSSTGFGIVNGSSVISDVYGLAIDTNNNIWVTNEQGYGGVSYGSITEFYGVNNPATLGTTPNAGGYTSGVYYPVSIATDTNGNIDVLNTDISSVTVYNQSGNVVTPFLGENAGLAAGQNAIALDAAHGFWISTNNQQVAHFNSTGTLLATANCCTESLGIATDAAGDLWIADYGTAIGYRGGAAEAVTDSNGNTSVPVSNLVTGGLEHPVAVAVDAAQNVWFANYLNNSVTELAGVNSTLPVATAISPSSSSTSNGGYGLDAHLGGPYSLIPDRSGNLWVTNESLYTLTMFFGLAAPTVTPLQPVPTAP